MSTIPTPTPAETSNPTPAPTPAARVVPGPLTPRIIAKAFRGPAGRLLAAIIVLIVCEPLIAAGPAWSVLTATAWNAALVALLFAASPHRRTHKFGLTLCAIDFVVHPLAAFGVVPRLIHLHSFLAFSMMLYAIVWILSEVFTAKRVTPRTLQQALCVYLLIGMSLAQLYLLIDMVQPGSFRFPNGLSDPTASYDMRRRETFELMYFSLVTLSTVGYGDVVPVRSIARIIAALEAVVGQIYLAVLIARLVGLHVAHSMLDEPGREASP
jgi:hypothetical protein